MSEKDKMIKLYELLYGAISANCYWEYDSENHLLLCMKDGNECWSKSREELTFEFITKDI